MGMLLILLGLAAAGLVADFVVENDLTTAPSQTVSLLGGSFNLSLPELVLGAAVLGALAVFLVMLGLGLLRGSWGRRRALKKQVADLRLENTDLRSKVHLGTVAGWGRARKRGPMPTSRTEAPGPRPDPSRNPRRSPSTKRPCPKERPTQRRLLEVANPALVTSSRLP
jgi:uncharacterized integral membrane protein